MAAGIQIKEIIENFKKQEAYDFYDEVLVEFDIRKWEEKNGRNDCKHYPRDREIQSRY